MDNDSSGVFVHQENVSYYHLNREPLYTGVPLTLLYCTIFLTGVFGNLMTCSVICQNRFMRTCTNYYLFSLAVSDLLILIVGLLPEIYSIWSFYPYPFGRFFCRFRSLAGEASSNATVLTIMAFTIERYFAICHPFLAKSVSRPSRAIRVIMLIWFLGFGLALPLALQFDVFQVNNTSGDYSVCAVHTDKETPGFFLFSFFFFFTLPMVLLTILYILIAFRLNANATQFDANSQRFFDTETLDHPRSRRVSGSPLCRLVRANRRATERKAVIKMLVAVVIAFFICWAPFHAQRMWSIYRKETRCAFLYYGSGVLLYVSSTINPILYNIMSKQFRKAFWISWQHFCVCRRRRKTPHSLRKRGSTSRPSSLGSTPTPCIRVPQSVLTQVSSHYVTTTV